MYVSRPERVTFLDSTKNIYILNKATTKNIYIYTPKYAAHDDAVLVLVMFVTNPTIYKTESKHGSPYLWFQFYTQMHHKSLP